MSDAVGGLMCHVNRKCFRHCISVLHIIHFCWCCEAGPCAASGVLLISKPTSTYIYLNLISVSALSMQYCFIHILVKKDGFVSTRFDSAHWLSVFFLLKCSIIVQLDLISLFIWLIDGKRMHLFSEGQITEALQTTLRVRYIGYFSS